jgi:chaperonin cofactor prefoldin
LPFDTENLEAELLTLKNKEEKTETDLNRIKEIYQEMMN